MTSITRNSFGWICAPSVATGVEVVAGVGAEFSRKTVGLCAAGC